MQTRCGLAYQCSKSELQIILPLLPAPLTLPLFPLPLLHASV
ncbi:hypothetical protein FDUTEX481_01500 [Tolypothrix sp. PCC 7601]|nr:hypothetical protein FDUTEX481_01500 [Tolypothrix sp. PCC 7601]